MLPYILVYFLFIFPATYSLVTSSEPVLKNPSLVLIVGAAFAIVLIKKFNHPIVQKYIKIFF